MKRALLVAVLVCTTASLAALSGRSSAYSLPERWNSGAPMSSGSYPETRRIADFDGDGRPEIAELLPSAVATHRYSLCVFNAFGERLFTGPDLFLTFGFEIALQDVDQNGTVDYVLRGPVIADGAANLSVYGFDGSYRLLDSLATHDVSVAGVDWFYAQLEPSRELELVVTVQTTTMIDGAFAGIPTRAVKLHTFGTPGYAVSFVPGNVVSASSLAAEAHDLNENGIDELYVSYMGRLWMYSSDAAVAAVAPSPAVRQPVSLAAPWPNPGSGDTMVRFRLGYGASPTLRAHDAAGRNVRQIALPLMPAGEHEYRWDGRLEDQRHAAPGVYWLELDVAGVTATRRIVRLR